MEIPSYTPYRISTITAIGNINSSINLQKLFDLFKPTDKIVYMEYGKTKDISNFKGIHPNEVKFKKRKNKKRFDNQCTTFIKFEDDTFVNMKIFKNGKVQMTGLKDVKNGRIAINNFINYIKETYKNNEKKNIIINNYDNLSLTNYKICLINSDFRFNIKLKRDDLYKYIINNTKLICSYEPCIYPGVKIQYYYNNNDNGICDCCEYCENKNKNAKCTKITIAIFESGCTIITGAKNLEQINSTYTYIATLLKNNIDKFKKKPLPILEPINDTSPIVEPINDISPILEPIKL